MNDPNYDVPKSNGAETRKTIVAQLGQLGRVRNDSVVIPIEPPMAVLISMAIREDHALACPGYYDQSMFSSGPTHKQVFDAAIARMRQLYEEVAGTGFYDPKRADYYERIQAATYAPKESEPDGA